ncbi:MAG: hypothetical protein AAF401_02910, partial [Pseudomonadota bacterium]
MNDIIWLTNIDTAEPVGLSAAKMVLIEQKRPQDGGAVAIYLDFGKEVHVAESLSRVRELTEGASSDSLWIGTNSGGVVHFSMRARIVRMASSSS